MTNATNPHDPKGPQEWQEAVDQAEFFLLLDSAKLYGLIEGGPEVNAARCEEILKHGATLGYFPRDRKALCDAYVPALMATVAASG